MQKVPLSYLCIECFWHVRVCVRSCCSFSFLREVIFLLLCSCRKYSETLRDAKITPEWPSGRSHFVALHLQLREKETRQYATKEQYHATSKQSQDKRVFNLLVRRLCLCYSKGQKVA